MEQSCTERTVILGVGNILLQDEGVGVRVVETLQTHYRFADEVLILDGATMGLDLITTMEDADRLLVVDAIDAAHPPGTILRLTDDEIPALLQNKISPHQIGLSDMLGVAKLCGTVPREVVLIGIQPASLATSLELSPTIQSRMDDLIQAVLDQLEVWGIGCTNSQ